MIKQKDIYGTQIVRLLTLYFNNQYVWFHFCSIIQIKFITTMSINLKSQ